MTILDLEPKEVWRYFDEISRIPRGSGNEAAVREHIIEFAKANGLYYNVDSVGNLILRKAGRNGNTQSSIVFQSHMDMVCEKNSNVNHDFRKDPIDVVVEGDTVRANGTTLGGDDGIGVAMAMALLTDSTIERPIEALFTVDEERGLTGAQNLKPGMLISDKMINLDTEDDEEIIIGCAGGKDTSLWFDIEKERVPYKPFSVKIKVSGLKGGHSGEDIDKPRVNANILLAEFLKRVIESGDAEIRVADINGGGLRNAIPREAEACITLPWSYKEGIRIAWNIYESECEEKYGKIEPLMKLTLESVAPQEEAYTKSLTEAVINTLCTLPHGVVEMNAEMPYMVEVSTNLAFVRECEGKVLIGTSQRSPNLNKRDAIAEQVAEVGRQNGATITSTGGYPGWEPKADSVLRDAAVETYRELFKSEPKVKSIHAGLECGLFTQSYPEMDMISVGPKITGVHSPDETLYISTVEKCWKFVKKLCDLLP